MDPLSLDWGAASSEFFNEEQKSAVHILQHDLTSPEKAARSARFALARVAWFGKKQGCTSQEVCFDDREQAVDPASRGLIKAALASKVAAVSFFGEEA
jgi:thiol:disulfide interchange protein